MRHARIDADPLQLRAASVAHRSAARADHRGYARDFSLGARDPGCACDASDAHRRYGTPAHSAHGDGRNASHSRTCLDPGRLGMAGTLDLGAGKMGCASEAGSGVDFREMGQATKRLDLGAGILEVVGRNRIRRA